MKICCGKGRETARSPCRPRCSFSVAPAEGADEPAFCQGEGKRRNSKLWLLQKLQIYENDFKRLWYQRGS